MKVEHGAENANFLSSDINDCGPSNRLFEKSKNAGALFWLVGTKGKII